MNFCTGSVSSAGGVGLYTNGGTGGAIYCKRKSPGGTRQSGFHYANEHLLMEVANEHDVGIVFVELGEEQVAAVRGNGDAVVKIAIGFENVVGFLG